MDYLQQYIIRDYGLALAIKKYLYHVAMEILQMQNRSKQHHDHRSQALQKSATAKNIFAIVDESLKIVLGLSTIDIARKLVCIGMDGCSVIWRSRAGFSWAVLRKFGVPVSTCTILHFSSVGSNFI